MAEGGPEFFLLSCLACPVQYRVYHGGLPGGEPPQEAQHICRLLRWRLLPPGSV